jgi:hypothetical protein
MFRNSSLSETTTFAHPVEIWTAQRQFQFPPALTIHSRDEMASKTLGICLNDNAKVRVIQEEPPKNTQQYLLMTQYNPWLDCEMTREKREYLKPRAGEFCYPVYPLGGSPDHSSSLMAVSTEFFRNETVMDIVNLYLWPLLYSRSDEVVACKTFSDWRRLFSRTISLAFPGYEYWRSVVGAVQSATTLSAEPALAAFIPIADQRRIVRILQYLTPGRVLYLLTTSSKLWPYGVGNTTIGGISGGSGGGGVGSRSSRRDGGGICVIKPKIKDYNDKTEIDWLVTGEFLRKMKRIHIYFTYSKYTVTASLSDSDGE